MTPSNFNIETLMLTLHQKVEEYLLFVTSKIHEGDPIDHVTNPPNFKFKNEEENALLKLKVILTYNRHLKNYLLIV